MVVGPNTVFEIPEAASKSPPLWGSARLCYTICAFLAMVVHVCLRNTINFAILCMVKQPPHDNTTIHRNTLKGDNHCQRNVANNNYEDLIDLQKNAEIEWTRSEEFALVGTFYYGYLVALPIAGRLTDHFGGKMFFVHSITTQSIVFMTIPFFARISFIATVIVRIIQGFIAGFGNPPLYQLFATWAHSSERTAHLSFAYAGFSVGALVAFPITSVLCDFGWEWSFYVVGGVSLAFGLCCQCLVYSNLEDHPRMSLEEYDYLKATRVEKSTTGVPWRAILTSGPVYAFILTHLFQAYGILVFTMLIPRFFMEAMQMDIDEVGIWSSSPFFGALLSKVITVASCTFFEQKNKENLTRFRRIVLVVSNTFTILFLYGITYFDCSQKMWVVALTVCFGITTDISFAGAYWPSLLFIAPKFAGLISGIANCFGTINGFIAPVAISKIVVDETKDEWNTVMYTIMVSYAIGGTIYGLFGNSKLADWSKPKENENRNAERT